MKLQATCLALSLAVLAPTVQAQSLSSRWAGHTPSSQDAPASDDQPKTDKKRLFKAGGLGCLAGGALGALIKHDKKAAVVGCVAGAVTGSIASYRKQLDEAKALAAEAQAAGMSAQVATKPVEADGQTTEALDAISIDYDPASMKAMDAKTASVLDRIAALAKKSKTPLTIMAEGTSAQCTVPLAELQRRGAIPPATAKDACGHGQDRLVISPVPTV
jgi:hypothetical protein